MFCRTSKLQEHLKICVSKKLYHKYLLKEQEKTEKEIADISVIVNNTINNNNNTINNNNNTVNQIILNFGEETMEHIELSDIIGILKEAKDEYRPDEFSRIAGEFIYLLDKLIKENPRNKNISIPSLNSMHASVKITNGWEMMPIDKVVHRLIKNTSKRIMEQRKIIDEYDKKNGIIGTIEGSKLRITPNILKEVGILSTDGITSNELETAVRTGLKLNNQFKLSD
jgi:hypothetical protein